MKLARARFAAGVAAILLFSATGMVQADSGDPVILGTTNVAGAQTRINYDGPPCYRVPGFAAECSPDGTEANFRGPASSALHVERLTDGFAIKAMAFGESGDANSSNVAVAATGGYAGLDAAGDKYGVIATGDLAAVFAEGTWIGVEAFGEVGVEGTGRVGVHAVAARPATAVALKVDGPAVFSRSGTVTIAHPAKSAMVTGVPVSASSLVLATAQNKAGVWVMAAVPNLGSGDGFTVFLNQPPGAGKSVVVAWFVLN